MLFLLLTCILTALDFTTTWCCDRKPCCDNGPEKFNLDGFFPGSFFTEEDYERSQVKPKRKYLRNQNRLVKEREPLQQRIREWRLQTHLADPLRVFSPATFIINNKATVKLSKVRADKLVSVADLTRILGETEEWSGLYGQQVFELVKAFDEDIREEIEGSDIDEGSGMEEMESGGEDEQDGGLESENESLVETRKRLAVGVDEGSRKRARVVVAPTMVPRTVSGRGLRSGNIR